MNTHLPELYHGHAPITLHQLFRDALDAYDDWEDATTVPDVLYEGSLVPISAVFDHMRDCTDILPNNMIGAIKDRLTKSWSSESPLDEMPFSTAARVMSIMVRKRIRTDGNPDVTAFIDRMERHHRHRRAT